MAAITREMHTHAEILSTAAQIQTLAETLSKEKVIAFDTEFIRENTFYPIVEIIQVATATDSWIVDAQGFKKGYKPGPQGGFDPAINPLLEVFENDKILKVLHAAQGDQECLYTSFGIVAHPTIDTAVAASLCGYGDAIGLGKLLKQMLDVTIKKGHARTNWSVRPLPSQLIEYAHADVTHLVAAAERLLEKLDKVGRREWAMQASARWEDKALYELDVEGTAKKLARSGRLDRQGYSALVELLRWREERVRQLNLPKRWVADDTVLVDLAHVRPKDMEHLSAFRGLNKGELAKSGEAILEALRRASSRAAEDSGYPSYPRPEIPTASEAQVLELLKCYVGFLADKHRIATKHLMTGQQLLPLVRNQIKTSEDLVKEKILSTEAAALIGDDLLAFVHGKKGLFVNGTQISIVDASGESR